MTERKEYSAGGVKMSFWFMEFRKVVGLLAAVANVQNKFYGR